MVPSAYPMLTEICDAPLDPPAPVVAAAPRAATPVGVLAADVAFASAEIDVAAAAVVVVFGGRNVAVA